MFVIDSHCDTPSILLEGVDLRNRGTRTHLDIPRIIEGGVDGIFYAIYIPASFDYKMAVEHSLSLISKCYDFVETNRDSVNFAFSAEDAISNKEQGLVSIFMGMENGSPIGENLAFLRFYYKMGIRYLTLCHSRHNQICDSCAQVEPKWGGLSPFGVELVKECNRIGMMIDCSHVSDNTFYDVLKYSKVPVVATHSSCRSLCSHPRNMTDEMIRSLASAGGVIQINFYPFFIDEEFSKDPQISSLCDEYKSKNLSVGFIPDKSFAFKICAVCTRVCPLLLPLRQTLIIFDISTHFYTKILHFPLFLALLFLLNGHSPHSFMQQENIVPCQNASVLL